MAPGRVLTCVARVSADAGAGAADPNIAAGLRELTASPHLDEEAELLGRGSVDRGAACDSPQLSVISSSRSASRSGSRPRPHSEHPTPDAPWFAQPDR
jgi:hypothetical protein